MQESVGEVGAEYLVDDYVTEEEFNALKNHVEEMEAMLSDESSTLFMVREEEEDG